MRLRLCLCLLAFALLPLTPVVAHEKSVIDQALERGALRVGVSEFVPWVMRDKTGELIGFEIDVATRLAQDLGLKVEFVPTPWSGIIPALLTGKFDMIIGGMGIRPERSLKVNFSIPYDHSGMSLVANQSLARGFTTLEDFNRPEVILSSRLGTTAATAARARFPKARQLHFDSEPQAVQEVLNGRAHAFVTSAPTPAFLAYRHPGILFLPVRETFTAEPIGFALRKGDADSLNVFDSWIRVVEAEGWLQQRRAYWFGGQEWESRVK